MATKKEQLKALKKALKQKSFLATLAAPLKRKQTLTMQAVSSPVRNLATPPSQKFYPRKRPPNSEVYIGRA
jgi:hypothetical protein